MLEIIIVALIVVVAAVLVARSVHKAVNASKPPCACGTTECPLMDACSHQANGDGKTATGCGLTTLVRENRTTVAKS